MARKCFLIAVLTILALLSTQSVAQTSAAKGVSPELIELRAQVSTMRDYQDRFLGIVLWSLGTVVTVTFALFAFGWFTNKTSHDRDREALRQERDALRLELRALVADESRAISQDVDARYTANEKALQERLAKAFDEKLARYDARLKDVKHDVLDIQFDDLQREAAQAMREKNPSWALYKYVRLLGLSVKRQMDEIEVPDILDDMRKALLSPDLRADAEDVTRIVEGLGRLPKRYEAAAEKLIALVKSKL